MAEEKKPHSHYYVVPLFRDGSNALHLHEERIPENLHHDIVFATMLVHELNRRNLDNSVYMVLAEICTCEEIDYSKFNLPAELATKMQTAVLDEVFSRQIPKG